MATATLASKLLTLGLTGALGAAGLIAGPTVGATLEEAGVAFGSEPSMVSIASAQDDVEAKPEGMPQVERHGGRNERARMADPAVREAHRAARHAERDARHLERDARHAERAAERGARHGERDAERAARRAERPGHR